MKQDMKTQLLTQSPKELLFKLAIPGIIGMLVVGLYPFMDGIFAGRLIGDYAMSAISVSMSLTIPLIVFLQSNSKGLFCTK